MNDEHKHPSYGLINISNVTVSGKGMHLFGSAIPGHGHVIEFTISEASLEHKHGKDWTRGGRQIAKVAVSAAQFAKMITTLNMGEGTPCTIVRRIYGDLESIPEPPRLKTETERVRDAARRSIASAAKPARALATEIMAKVKDLPAARRRDIEIALDSMVMGLEKNAPFALDCFEEAAEHVVAAAGAEIEAMATGAVFRAGLESIQVRGLLTGGAGENDTESETTE